MKLLLLLQLPLISCLSRAVTGESWEDQDSCADTFTELEEYIFSNQTSNHEILESIFFPINDLSPSYVQVQYNHSCKHNKDRQFECRIEKATFYGPANKTWLWASSPVYLVYHPEALSALAMTVHLGQAVVGKPGIAFSTNIGGDMVCVCLPPICPNSTASTDMLRNLTALVSPLPHTHTHTHTRTHTHACMHMYTHMHMHIHMHRRTRMHAYTHTHTTQP